MDVVKKLNIFKIFYFFLKKLSFYSKIVLDKLSIKHLIKNFCNKQKNLDFLNQKFYFEKNFNFFISNLYFLKKFYQKKKNKILLFNIRKLIYIFKNLFYN